MKSKSFIFFALLFSLLLHIFLAFSLSLYIEAKADPVISSLQSILNYQDLMLVDEEIQVPQGIDLSLDAVRKQYFTAQLDHYSFFERKLYSRALNHEGNYPLVAIDADLHKQRDYSHLWQQTFSFSSRAEEEISYKGFVSPYGKVILLYPRTLSVDSPAVMHLQQYLRESTVFFEEKFFWTNLKGVIK